MEMRRQYAQAHRRLSLAMGTAAACAALVFVFAAATSCTQRSPSQSAPARAPERPALTDEQAAARKQQAREAFGKQDYQRTVQVLEPVVASNAEDSEALGLRGRARLELGQPAEAVADLSAAVAVEPENAEVQAALAEAYDRLNDVEAAEPHARAAAESLADDAWAHYAHGLLLAELGRHKEAAEAFRAADDLEPYQPQILVALAESELACGNLEKAQDNAWAAIEAVATAHGRPDIDPKWAPWVARSYELIARAELAKGKATEKSLEKEVAKSYLAEIVGAVGDPILAKYHQARAWREAGLIDSAIWTIKGTEPPANVGWANAELARILLEAGTSADVAAQAATRAIELDGECAELLGLRGWAEFKNKQYEPARRDLEAALALARTKQQRALLNYRLFRACEALGDSASALSYRETARSLGYKEP